MALTLSSAFRRCSDSCVFKEALFYGLLLELPQHSALMMMLIPLWPAPSTTTCDLRGILEDVATAVIADEFSLKCWPYMFFIVRDG